MQMMDAIDAAFQSCYLIQYYVHLFYFMCLDNFPRQFINENHYLFIFENVIISNALTPGFFVTSKRGYIKLHCPINLKCCFETLSGDYLL